MSKYIYYFTYLFLKVYLSPRLAHLSIIAGTFPLLVVHDKNTWVSPYAATIIITRGQWPQSALKSMTPVGRVR